MGRSTVRLGLVRRRVGGGGGSGGGGQFDRRRLEHGTAQRRQKRGAALALRGYRTGRDIVVVLVHSGSRCGSSRSGGGSRLSGLRRRRRRRCRCRLGGGRL